MRFLAYNRNGDNYFLDFQVDDVLVGGPPDLAVTAARGATRHTMRC